MNKGKKKEDTIYMREFFSNLIQLNSFNVLIWIAHNLFGKLWKILKHISYNNMLKKIGFISFFHYSDLFS